MITSSLDGSISLFDLADQVNQAAATSQKEQTIDETETVEEQPRPSPAVLPLDPLATTATLAAADSSTASFVTCIHPDGQTFVSSGIGGAVSLHSALPDAFGQLLSSAPPDRVSTSAASTASSHKELFALKLAMSPTGSLLAVGTNVGHVHLYSLHIAAGKGAVTFLARYTSHALPIRALAFDSASTLLSSKTDDRQASYGVQDNHLFVGGDDRIISIYDVQSVLRFASRGAEGQSVPSSLTQPVSFLQGHKGPISFLAPSPTERAGQGDGSARSRPLLASTSVLDGTVRLWDLEAVPKACVCNINLGGIADIEQEEQRRTQQSRPLDGHIDAPEMPQDGEAVPAQAPSKGSRKIRVPQLGRGGWTIAWRPTTTANNGSKKGRKRGHAFVVGGGDGVVRWFRGAGDVEDDL